MVLKKTKKIPDTSFEDILILLKDIKEEYPTQRFGQILQGAVDIGKRKKNFNLEDVSSKQIRLYLEEYKNKLNERKNNKGVRK